MPPLLEIRGLEIAFPGATGEVSVVRGLDLELLEGEVLGLVGESGSGKSVTALAVLGLVPSPGRIRSGSVRLEGRELVGAPERELRAVRGAKVGLVFQEPSAALNPVLTIGAQIVEAIRAHRPVSKREARERAIRLLEQLAIPDPERRLGAYPHELSGGQRQRALVAIALAAEPRLLIADEPTTALDVTVQAQVLELLAGLRTELGLAILLITHDLAVVAETCDRIAVMYAGEIVEEASAADLFARPQHPYTRGLLASLPRIGSGDRTERLFSIPGQVPTPERRPPGCPFHPRCELRRPECERSQPPRIDLAPGRWARCFAVEAPAAGGDG